jgi:acetoin utilization protein AcuB
MTTSNKMSATIRSCMTQEVLTVGPQENLPTIEKILDLSDFHHIPVVNPNGKVLGMITPGDIKRKQVEMRYQQEQENPCAKDIMNLHVVAAHPEDTLSSALQLMTTFGVHSLPVVDKGQLVGIITSSDIKRALAATPVTPLIAHP